jgi:polyisoprenoid-binding protein YceI
MALEAGRHHLDTERGRIVLRTFRDGFASQAGHDLTIEVTRWSGDLTVGDDSSPADLSVRVDMGSLVVRTGTGGLKSLTDADRREIAVTARRVLGADRHPEAVFAAGEFEPAADGGGLIGGTFTLAGVARPVRLRVSQTAPGRYRATGSVRQSDYGIKPYTAFFGALKVRDAIDVEVDIDLSGPAGPEPPR